MKFLTIALAATFLVAALPTAEAASQNWYLGGDGVLTAYRQNIPAPDDEDFPYVTVPDGQFLIWYADEAALIDVAFGSGDFTFSIQTLRDVAGKFHVEIGYGDDVTETFHSAGASAQLTGALGQKIFTGNIPVTTFTVPEGQKLAFKIANDADATGGSARAVRVVIGDDDSRFTSTMADPGYPTPELGSIVLVGAGVAGIVGFVALRRRS